MNYKLPDESKSIAKSPVITKHKKSISAHKTDLNKMMKQLRTCLERDVKHLMVRSYVNKLEETDAADLRGYIKLVKDLLKDDKDSKAEVSNEDLNAMSKG